MPPKTTQPSKIREAVRGHYGQIARQFRPASQANCCGPDAADCGCSSSIYDGTLLADLPADGQLPRIAALPSPLLSDTFEHTTILNADSTEPIRTDGWTILRSGPFGKGWRADSPGSVLALEVEGTAIGLVFHRIKRDMGIAQAQVDDAEPVKMSAWFDADWGGYSAWQLIATCPESIRLTIRCASEISWVQTLPDRP